MNISRGEISINVPLTSQSVSTVDFAELLNHFWWQSDDAFDIDSYAESVTDRLDPSGIEFVKTLAGYLGMIDQAQD